MFIVVPRKPGMVVNLKKIFVKKLFRLIASRYYFIRTINVASKTFKNSKAYAKLNQFLKINDEAGNISFQEAASMIPSLVLDVQSHHKVKSFV